MRQALRFLLDGTRKFLRRLRTQGPRLTLVWLYGRGLPLITGVPLLRYGQVTPALFVGSQHGRMGKRKLQRLGIHASVNLRSEFDDDAHGLALASACHLPTPDNTAPSLEHLHQGIAFIRKVLESGGKVYVHCLSGIGRAPTLAAAYLISQGMTAEEAVEAVRRVRPFIDLTPPQIEQLKTLALLHHRQPAGRNRDGENGKSRRLLVRGKGRQEHPEQHDGDDRGHAEGRRETAAGQVPHRAG
jgi:protein-tyrosine phosphatase